MDIHQKDLYPDVTASGGLAQAMREAAELRGRDIDLPSWGTDAVTVETARGYVSVELSAERRLFRVRVHIPEFAWEIGATDDLGVLVEAMAAWQNGVSLDELAAGFEFLELDEFAGALDRGEPTSSQWADLLSSDFHQGQQDLLRRLHADEVLRNMFPTISHGAVRLRVDPMDGASRQVLVHEFEERRYEVTRPGVPGATWDEVSSSDLVAHLRAALSGAE